MGGGAVLGAFCDGRTDPDAAYFADLVADLTAADPKPAARIVDPDMVRRYLLLHPWCEAPGCPNPAWHAHHVLYRSQGGDDIDANLLSLCGDHHDAVHKTRDTDWLQGVRLAIEARDDVKRYLARKKQGRVQAFVDRVYPR